MESEKPDGVAVAPAPPSMLYYAYNTFVVTAFRTLTFWYAKATTLAVNTHMAEGLFIGMIPHMGVDSLIDFVREHEPNRPLGLIMSVLEADEQAGVGFLGVSVVATQAWTDRGVETHLVVMPDFTANVDPQKAVDALLKMRACIEAGQSVFVHCKAGRSRSAVFIEAYLVLFCINPLTNETYTPAEAIALLKVKRPEVSIDAAKEAKAEEIIQAFRERAERSPREALKSFNH